MIGSPANRRGWVVATALAVALAGCGHGGKHTLPPAAAPTTTAVTASAVSPNDIVVAAWRHYWDVYIAVGEQMKLPDPRLAQVATGQELRTLGGAFLAAESQGEVLRGNIDLNPKVVSVTGSTASLRDCYLSTVLGYKNDQPVGPPDPRRRLVSVTLLLDGGTWKISAIDHLADGCSGP